MNKTDKKEKILKKLLPKKLLIYKNTSKNYIYDLPYNNVVIFPLDKNDKVMKNEKLQKKIEELYNKNINVQKFVTDEIVFDNVIIHNNTYSNKIQLKMKNSDIYTISLRQLIDIIKNITVEKGVIKEDLVFTNRGLMTKDMINDFVNNELDKINKRKEKNKNMTLSPDHLIVGNIYKTAYNKIIYLGTIKQDEKTYYSYIELYLYDKDIYSNTKSILNEKIEYMINNIDDFYKNKRNIFYSFNIVLTKNPPTSFTPLEKNINIFDYVDISKIEYIIDFINNLFENKRNDLLKTRIKDEELNEILNNSIRYSLKNNLIESAKKLIVEIKSISNEKDKFNKLKLLNNIKNIYKEVKNDKEYSDLER